MFAHLFGYALADWHLWVGPAAGLVSTGITLYVGRYMFRKPTPLKMIKSDSDFLLDQYFQGGQPDNRQSPRRLGNPTPIQIVNRDMGGRLFEGCVMDRSVGGLGLSVFRPIDPGT